MDDTSSTTGGLSPNRYAVIPDGLLADPGVSHAAVRVYAIIVRYQGRHEVAWPSARTIERDYGIPRASVSRAVTELCDTGWVEVVHRAGTSNLYRPMEVSHVRDTVSHRRDGVSHGRDVTNPKNEPQERESVVSRSANDPPREDITELCVALRDHVHTVTDRRMTWTTPPAAWVTPMRLLIDRDGVSPEAIRRCITWLGGATEPAQFWSRNVLSPKSLRQHWDRMSAQARGNRSTSAVSAAEHNQAARERLRAS